MFFWKFTSILNTFKLNLLFLIILFVLFSYYSFFKNSLVNRYIIFIGVYVLITFFFQKDCTPLFRHNYPFFFKKINVALLNGVLNVHPWLIYMYYAISLSLLVFFFSKENTRKNLTNQIYSYYNKKLTTLALTSFSIILGGYWAFQELSWGGWWNWDIVELISLIFFFLSASVFHRHPVAWIKSKESILAYQLFFGLLISIVIIRFNLLSSIHAFVSPNILKISFLKLICLNLLAIQWIFFSYKFFNWHQTFYKNTHKPFSVYFNTCIYFIYNYILIYIAYILLINNDKIELTLILELLFAVILVYFILFFFKTILYKNTMFIFCSKLNVIYILIFYLSYTPNVKNFNLKQNSRSTFHRTLHNQIVISMIFIYFFKLYFWGSTLCSDLFVLDQNFLKSFGLSSNFVFLFDTKTINTTHYYFNISIFYEYWARPFNFNKELLIQYYKNFLHIYGSNIIKSLIPSTSMLNLFYPILLIALLLTVVLFFLKFFFLKYKKNIKII